MKTLSNRVNLSYKEKRDKAGEIDAKFYVTAGEKCKVIGTQDGFFPDFGHHLEEEMGGVWLHPIKIMDGFWTSINDEWIIANEYRTLPYGNIFYYELPGGVRVKRFQYSPDEVRGFIVEYRFENPKDQDIVLDIESLFRFDLLPVWQSEDIGIERGKSKAKFHQESGYVVSEDTENPWYGVLGVSERLTKDKVHITEEHIGPEYTAGDGVSVLCKHSIEVRAHGTKTLSYYIAGSWHDEDEAIAECNSLISNERALLDKKIRRYRNIKQGSDLHTDDIAFNRVYDWIKYNTDWLVQDSEEFGRGVMAGIPEYVWWFGCDSSYSIQGLLGIGWFEEAKDTLRLLKEYSEKANGNGRIVHEVTTYGNVFHPGNSQETSHYITAVYDYLKWTGDLELVREIYPYCVKGVDWLLGEMDPDGDMLPSGYGIIEIEGLNVELIDTAVYTCEALFSMYELSKALGCEEPEYLEKGEKLKDIINTRLWDEKQELYVDAVGTPRQILKRLPIIRERFKSHPTGVMEEYIEFLDREEERLKSLPPDEEIPFILNRNWVINTPMETGLADEDKAIRALKSMSTPDFVGKYGIYLSGYARDHIMTISTGAQAIAEARYGRCDESLELLERMNTTFGRVMPGSICEMSPDYGCFVQEWTIYAMAVPVVKYFAGIRPDAVNKRIVIDPCIPNKWNYMDLENIKIGDNSLDFGFKRYDDKDVYIITSYREWDIKFKVPSGELVTLDKVEVEGDIILGMGTWIIELYKDVSKNTLFKDL